MRELTAGRKADIVLLDLNKPHLTTLLLGEFSNVIPNVVFAAQGSDIETVLIDGKIVMENRVLRTVDEEEIIARASRVTYDLLERRKRFVPD